MPKEAMKATSAVELPAGRNQRVERRRHPRIATNLDVEAWWQDEFGYPCAFPAVVKDAAAGGFGLELTRKPPLGCLLRVRTVHGSIRSIAQHVTRQGRQYRVGVEVLPSAAGPTLAKDLERLAAALSSAQQAAVDEDLP